MNQFMNENFLLQNAVAVTLYHDYAKGMPVYDYHCHLNPKDIWENRRYQNITELWLQHDHYKWRIMRANGIEEKYITGDAGDDEKFLAWAKALSKSIGNPLYHWTHLELQRYFGIHDVLNEKTADKIWTRANAILQDSQFNVRNIIIQSNVKVICTTDDPTDSLEYHQLLKSQPDFPARVLPTFRPDLGLEINKAGFAGWVKKLQDASGQPIHHYHDFLEALSQRIEFFHSVGCRISDHSLTNVPYEETDAATVAGIFSRALKGEKVSLLDEALYKTYTLNYLGQQYAQRHWVMQLHIGALRNTNARMFNELGPDSGYDSMNDTAIAVPLAKLLDSLERENRLPKTILYTLNPKDNYVLASMIGNFQGGGIAGKIQFGSGWWFNDHQDGMREQMKALYNCGVLSRFIGMLTDSRSFLSYTRHEYFRRILCNLVGEWVTRGELPNDMEFLGSIVRDISFNNAKDYFQIEIE